MVLDTLPTGKINSGSLGYTGLALIPGNAFDGWGCGGYYQQGRGRADFLSCRFAVLLVPPPYLRCRTGLIAGDVGLPATDPWSAAPNSRGLE